MIKAVIAGVFFALALFLFVSEVVGLFKFSYVLNRMHVTALGDTLGILFIIIGVFILRGISMASFKLLLVPVFMFLTGPVVTHLIADTEVLYNENGDKEYEKEDRT